MKVVALDETLVKPLERYLREDMLFNLYLLYDLLFLRSTKAQFHLALERDEIAGTLVIYRGYPYPSVWVQGSADAVQDLLRVPKFEKAVFHAAPDVAEIVQKAFSFRARYVEDYMLVKRSEARPVIRHEVRGLTQDDAYAYATSRTPRMRGRPSPKPSSEELEAARDFLSRNSVCGVFNGKLLVATASSHVKLPEGWVIGGVFTDPRYRGMGMATSTCSAILLEALAHTENVALFVRSDNLPARRVYDKLGFKKFRERVWLDLGTGLAP